MKPDARDAMMLAQTSRAGQLTTVWVLDEAPEAMRDLVRLRAQAMLTARCRAATGTIPDCGRQCKQVHSRYGRRHLDLPSHGRAVQVRVTVRRFRRPSTAWAAIIGGTREGDRINAVLAAAGYNSGLLLRWRARLLRVLFQALFTALQHSRAPNRPPKTTAQRFFTDD